MGRLTAVLVDSANSRILFVQVKIHGASILALQKEVARLHAVEEHLQSQGHAAEITIQDVRGQLVDVQDQLAAAKGQFQGYKSAVSVRTNELAATNHRLHGVRLQRDSARSATSRAKSDLGGSRRQIEEMERELSTLKAGKVEQERLLQQCIQQLDDARKQKNLDDKEIAKLEVRLTTCGKWLAITSKDLERYQDEMDKRAAARKRKSNDGYGKEGSAAKRRR